MTIAGPLAQVAIRQYAGESARFTAEAFDGVIGKRTNLRASPGVIRDCFLCVGAEVADDGSYVDLIFEMPAKLMLLLNSGLLG